MAEFMVVDADSHIQDKREDVLEYLDEPFRRRYAWKDRPWLFFPRNTWDFRTSRFFGTAETSRKRPSGRSCATMPAGSIG